MEVELIEPESHENSPFGGMRAEGPLEPSEPVILKRRGRPKGSLNKKTIEKMRQDVLPEDGPETILLEREEDTSLKDHYVVSPMALDVDFTSDEILGEKPRATPKRNPKAAPKARDPPTEPPSEEDDSPPPPPPPITKKRPKTLSDTYRAPEPVYPASYLEVLTRGLKEAKAKQYAEKVAQYDSFFRW